MQVTIEEYKYPKKDTEHAVIVEGDGVWMCVRTAPGTTLPEAELTKTVFDHFLATFPDAEAVIRKAGEDSECE